MNRVCVVGRVVALPEVKDLPSGEKIAKVRIAVWQGKEETGFFTCISFGRTAEIVAQAKKGEEVGVEGRLKQRKYQRKDGSAAEIIEISIDVFTRFYTQQPAKVSPDDMAEIDKGIIDELPDYPNERNLPDDDLPF